MRAAGLAPAAIPPLAAYLDLVATWSTRVNLTGARTARERVEILVAPVAPLAPLLRPGRLLDLGSGNGSPGLVLAALRPDLQVTLLEPRQRRWAFLREAGRAIGRPEVDVRRDRFEDYAGPPAENVTVRALALPGRAAARLLAAGGVAWSFGGALRPDAAVVPGPAAIAGVEAWVVSRETGR